MISTVEAFKTYILPYIEFYFISGFLVITLVFYDHCKPVEDPRTTTIFFLMVLIWPVIVLVVYGKYLIPIYYLNNKIKKRNDNEPQRIIGFNNKS